MRILSAILNWAVDDDLMAANPAQRKVLTSLGDPDLDTDGVAAIQAVLRETGAAAAVEADIAVLRALAVESIVTSGLRRVAIDALVELAHFVTERDH